MSWLDALSESKAASRLAPAGKVPGPLAGQGRHEGRVGDDFNESANWADILKPLGAVLHHEAFDGEQYWTRPGKDRRDGYSATTGRGDADRLMVFTSSWSPFAQGGVYDKFGAFALVHHGGDHKAAARALAQQGFGRQAAGPDRSSTRAAGSGFEVPHPANLVDGAETAPVDPTRTTRIPGHPTRYRARPAVPAMPSGVPAQPSRRPAPAGHHPGTARGDRLRRHPRHVCQQRPDRGHRASIRDAGCRRRGRGFAVAHYR